MTICKTCLVELDDHMSCCPLCGTPVGDAATIPLQNTDETGIPADEEKRLLHRILWQVTAILLLSGIVATLVIDLSRNGAVTWSVYPLSICMIVLSYASLLAFWRTRLIFQILAGWVLSTLLLLTLSHFFPVATWTRHVGISILFAVNLIAIILLGIFSTAKRKSLNLIAVLLVAISALCIAIEGILARYFEGKIELAWSIIVAACLLPVTAALIFMHYRTRKSSILQKFLHT